MRRPERADLAYWPPIDTKPRPRQVVCAKLVCLALCKQRLVRCGEPRKASDRTASACLAWTTPCESMDQHHGVVRQRDLPTSGRRSQKVVPRCQAAFHIARGRVRRPPALANTLVLERTILVEQPPAEPDDGDKRNSVTSRNNASSATGDER